jgi:hypothetical protein
MEVETSLLASERFLNSKCFEHGVVKQLDPEKRIVLPKVYNLHIHSVHVAVGDRVSPR